jgi:16S rRNA (guanine(966)-N(2))-methyltransferase RsmD
MRIIGGEARSRRLRTLKGGAVRPTLGRVRQRLFDILGQRVVGARFLDLFAGSGAVGIEALSRGAAAAVFVEADRRAVGRIRENLAEIDLRGKSRVIAARVETALKRLASEGEQFEIVFLDPPYDRGEALEATLDRLGETGELLAEGGVVVVQCSSRYQPKEAAGILRRGRSRIIGDTALWFYERKA